MKSNSSNEESETKEQVFSAKFISTSSKPLLHRPAKKKTIILLSSNGLKGGFFL